MKKLLFSVLFIQIIFVVKGQIPQGRIIVDSINASSLYNIGGENPVRRITIYLPPNYDETTNRYPVIYYLHGFAWSDSLLIASDHLDQLFDKAIATGKIRPVIIVMPNEYTLYKGSFYTNSTLTGNWADFTAKDLVKYIDQHYRTIANKGSRGIAGHSMGGHGALKLAMLFPDVFSSVYALSPAVLALEKDMSQTSVAYKRAQQIKTKDELVKGWNEVQANLVVAIGRAYSPDINNPPFYTDLPFTYQGDSLIINTTVLDIWNKNSPYYMIDAYIDNIRKLKAIKLDWGRNDEFTHIPVTCKMFSQKLEKLGVNHYAEEYIGTHGSKICSDDGRLLNELLPFFNTYLSFEELEFIKNN
jgi:S-formylglutathione hydrolase FrmB